MLGISMIGTVGEQHDFFKFSKDFLNGHFKSVCTGTNSILMTVETLRPLVPRVSPANNLLYAYGRLISSWSAAYI